MRDVRMGEKIKRKKTARNNRISLVWQCSLDALTDERACKMERRDYSEWRARGNPNNIRRFGRGRITRIYASWCVEGDDKIGQIIGSQRFV